MGNLIRESEEDENVVVKEVVKEVVVKEPGEMKVRLSQIEPNREQPRKVFDEDALIELSESIKQYGVLQPLLVQKKDKYYEIIAGERRWRGSKAGRSQRSTGYYKRLLYAGSHGACG